MRKEVASLDTILEQTRVHGPKVIAALNRLLSTEDAELLASILRDEGLSIQAYDFPGTRGIWASSPHDGTPYRCTAVKELLHSLATTYGADCTTVEGFREILPHVAKAFRRPINRWGTAVSGMLREGYWVSDAVFETVNTDGEFQLIRDAGLELYDFKKSPCWLDEHKKPIPLARKATKELLRTLARRAHVDYTSPSGFRELIPSLTAKAFNKVPINVWGTTLGGMLARAYRGSPCDAIIDLVTNDDELILIKDVGLERYDLSGQNCWMDKEGIPTPLVWQATARRIQLFADDHRVDCTTVEGFRRLLPVFNFKQFVDVPISYWGTTLGGMLMSVYQESHINAILDAIDHRPEFFKIREVGLDRYDFPKVYYLWSEGSGLSGKRTPRGKPNDLARAIVKKFILRVAEQRDVDATSSEGFEQLLPSFNVETMETLPLNVWGTTAAGALYVYSSSPAKAIGDVISKDPDFKRVRRLKFTDALGGPLVSRTRRARGNYDGKVLRKYLSKEGLDLGSLGFYSFSSGEKRSVREILATEVADYFGDRKIAYFGLEGPAFGSYFALAQHASIDTSASLIPERDTRNYAVMKRIKNMHYVNRLLNGNSLSAVELFFGTAEKALRNTQKSFDFIFLDWLGHLSPAYIREMDLAHGRLRIPGMLALTLNQTPLSMERYRRQTGSTGTPTEFLQDWARGRGLELQELDYVGGDRARMKMSLYLLKSGSAASCQL